MKGRVIMRLNKTTWLGLMLTAVLLAVVPASAQPGWSAGEKGERGGGQEGGWADGERPGREGMQERRLERLTVFLDLNAEQVEQWRAAHEERAEVRQSGRAEIHGLHQQIREMTAASKPDATAIGELVIQAHQLRAAAQEEREEFHAELMAILTPEQQERFEAMQEARPERGRRGRQGRHGRRGPHNGGPGFLGDSPPRG